VAEWQTRQTQNLLSERTWEFKSPRPHQRTNDINGLYNVAATREVCPEAVANFVPNLSLTCPYLLRKPGASQTAALRAIMRSGNRPCAEGVIAGESGSVVVLPGLNHLQAGLLHVKVACAQGARCEPPYPVGQPFRQWQIGGSDRSGDQAIPGDRNKMNLRPPL
jgi:hypothetical protein